MNDTPICHEYLQCKDFAEWIPFHVGQRLERENAQMRAFIAECRPYMLASSMDGASQLYTKALGFLP